MMGECSSLRFQRYAIRAAIDQRGEFKVDDAEAPVGRAIGDVAHFAVFMANSILLEFGEYLFLMFLVQMLDATAAVGGHDFQVLGLDLEQPGHERAAFGLQMTEHAHLLLKTLLRAVPAKGLVHSPIVTDAHECANGVFHFVHEASLHRQSTAMGMLASATCLRKPPLRRLHPILK